MYVPDGMTEQEVIAEVNKAVSLMYSFKFGYYENNDICQQGWVFALEVLPKFKRELNVPLHKFLVIHLRNRFLNLQRNKVWRRQSPCACCPYFNKKKKVCKAFQLEEDCDKLMQWKRRNNSKQSLMTTKECLSETLLHETDPLEKMVNKEIIEFLNDKIPIEMRNDYCRLLDGGTLSKNKREKLYELIREILDEYNEK